MKKVLLILLASSGLLLAWCTSTDSNITAKQEQQQTEQNQQQLNAVQPAPRITWSLERDNLIKRFKLMNDRSVMFYMYIFIEWVWQPVGYYQVNKVSSVNSQLTNTNQIVTAWCTTAEQWTSEWNLPCSAYVLPSPAEDGSYGTNGDGVFGFTPEGIYIEHNMKYIVSVTPLTFERPVQRLAILNAASEKELNKIMDNIK